MLRFLLSASAALLAAAPALAQADEHEGHAPPPRPEDHSAHQAPQAPAEHHPAMAGVLGPYPATREASGTAWQPDSSRHGGVHLVAGDWTLMGHAAL